MNSVQDDLKDLLKFLVKYQSKKAKIIANAIEKTKNASVNLLMLKRGRFQKHFFHTSMVGLALVGLIGSGALGGDSMVAKSFPGVSAADPTQVQTYDPSKEDQGLKAFLDFNTSVSEKPRSEIIDYEVKPGETVSQIAEKFGIDTDTIKWANDLTSINSVKPGDKLKILPVSGVAVTVKSGDTLESISKKYNADSQAVVQFPFNDIPDDFQLKIGQVLIIPDGSPPEAPAPAKPKYQPQNFAQGPSGPSYNAPGGGSFMWPTTFQMISTYFAWWHPGIDMANRAAPPVQAADGGTVVVAGWPDNYGYGNRVVIDHGNGYQTLYAHLSNIYVSPGQRVGKGTTVGQMGSTGRSTGTHLHFEIRYKGIAVNPLAILR